MTADELHAFLADSILLWRLDASVVADGDNAVTLIRADGTPIVVHRSKAEDDSLSWRIDVPGAPPRSCPSAVVLLSVLRGILGGDPAGTRLRIAATPAP